MEDLKHFRSGKKVSSVTVSDTDTHCVVVSSLQGMPKSLSIKC